MAELKIFSARVSTGSGSVLPAQTGWSYRIVDWKILVNTATTLSLFFGSSFSSDGDTGFKCGLVHTEVLAASGISKRPDNLLDLLLAGGENEAFALKTDPVVTPDGMSFVRYQMQKEPT